jgi:hypothetical protein
VQCKDGNTSYTTTTATTTAITTATTAITTCPLAYQGTPPSCTT